MPTVLSTTSRWMSDSKEVVDRVGALFFLSPNARSVGDGSARWQLEGSGKRKTGADDSLGFKIDLSRGRCGVGGGGRHLECA